MLYLIHKLRVHSSDILMWKRIRIRGSMPLTVSGLTYLLSVQAQLNLATWIALLALQAQVNLAMDYLTSSSGKSVSGLNYLLSKLS